MATGNYLLSLIFFALCPIPKSKAQSKDKFKTSRQDGVVPRNKVHKAKTIESRQNISGNAHSTDNYQFT